MSILASRPRALALLAGLAAAAAGCSPPSYTGQANPDIPIPAGATVGFLGATAEGAPQVSPEVSNDIMHARIQKAIAAQLAAKGYKAVPAGQNPTFGIRYFVGMNQSTSYVTTTTGMAAGPYPYYGGYGPYGYGYGYGWGGGISSSTTTPVTTTNVQFVVELVQTSSGQTAWQGVYKGEASSSPPSDKTMNQKAAQLFKTLPQVPGTTPAKN